MAAQEQEKTILIVDDDDDLASALARMLQAEGYGVLRAADGAEGVSMASEHAPDLILLDYMMPVKNGFDACRELRNLPGLDEVPILALTAYGQNIGETYGLGGSDAESHVNGFIEKPYEPNVLLERVASALRS